MQPVFVSENKKPISHEVQACLNKEKRSNILNMVLFPKGAVLGIFESLQQSFKPHTNNTSSTLKHRLSLFSPLSFPSISFGGR